MCIFFILISGPTIVAHLISSLIILSRDLGPGGAENHRKAFAQAMIDTRTRKIFVERSTDGTGSEGSHVIGNVTMLMVIFIYH